MNVACDIAFFSFCRNYAKLFGQIRGKMYQDVKLGFSINTKSWAGEFYFFSDNRSSLCKGCNRIDTLSYNKRENNGNIIDIKKKQFSNDIKTMNNINSVIRK